MSYGKCIEGFDENLKKIEHAFNNFGEPSPEDEYISQLSEVEYLLDLLEIKGVLTKQEARLKKEAIKYAVYAIQRPTTPTTN